MDKDKIPVYKVKEIVIRRSLICTISLAILILLLNIRLGINNVITDVYTVLSLIATFFLIICFPLLKYEHNKKIDKVTKIAFEISDFFSIFIVACCVIQAFFTFGYFRAEVNQTSMVPTFTPGDVVIVHPTKNVQKRDVVVVYYDEEANPENNALGIKNKTCNKCGSTNINKVGNGKYQCLDCHNIMTKDLKTSDLLIKRLIATPGDTLEVRGGNIIINHDYTVRSSSSESYNLNNFIGKGLTYDRDNDIFTLEEGYYFLMGDNRNGSLDSRHFGPFKEKYIVGRVDFTANSLFDFVKVKRLEENELQAIN